MRFFLFTMLLVIAGCQLGLGSPLTLQQHYLDVYLKVNEADEMEHRGQLRAAYVGFTSCRVDLIELSKESHQYVDLREIDRKLKDLEVRITHGQSSEPAWRARPTAR